MKLAAVFLAVFATIALAAPAQLQPRYYSDHSDDHDDKAERPEWVGWYKSDGSVRSFTSYLRTDATADQVVNASNVATPGFGNGTFTFALNSEDDYICWAIRVNIRGDYSSPAVTATHIHQAAVGRAGPPRIAFSNPVIEGDVTATSFRQSYGCLDGPFRTGINAANTTTDTGTNFTIAQLEADPSGFFADTHTAEFLPGAIRGQLAFY